MNIVETPAPDKQEDEISMILANGKRKADNKSIESASISAIEICCFNEYRS